MASKGMAIATVILRIFTISFAAGCAVVMIGNKFTEYEYNITVTFKNVVAYRYMLAIAVVAAVYSLLQLVFSIYHACTKKKLVSGHDFLPAVDFYGDRMIAFVLLTGVGAGFVATVELKEFLDGLAKELGADLEDSKFEGFFNKGYRATGLLTGAFLCMVILSIFSSLRPTSSTGSKGSDDISQQ